MSLPPLGVDADIEKLIKKAQQSFGTIAASDLGGDDLIPGIYQGWMRSKMLQYKLIEKSPNSNTYYLTERGWLFESFALETKHYKRERYLKNHAYWRAKYWWALAIFGFIIGSIITPITIERLKTRFQESPKAKATETSPVKKTK